MATEAERGHEWPIRFEEWPRVDQAQRVADDYYRAALIARCCYLADYPVDQSALAANSQVTKDMLGAMYLELKGFDHDE